MKADCNSQWLFVIVPVSAHTMGYSMFSNHWPK